MPKKLDKEDLAQFIENLPAGAVYVRNGSLSFNQKIVEILGYTSDEITTVDQWFRALHGEEAAERRRSYEKGKLARRTDSIVFDVRVKSGETRWLECSFSFNVGWDIWLLRDVTERRREMERKERSLQKERARAISSAKMASLGEMAGGIAHEINNPLAIIAGRSSQLRSRVEKGLLEPERIIETAEKIEATAFRIAKIIRGLKAFSRDGSKDPLVSAPIRTIIEDSLELCQSRFRNNSISVKLVEPISDLILVHCRPVEISQVLINLLGNAYDAVENLSERWVTIEVDQLLDAVEIRVMDSGKGIPESDRDRILEPFFTTKEPGRGTGLGLSISQGIAQSHGGSIRLDTECTNTCFVLTLCRPSGAQEMAASSSEKASEARSAAEQSLS